jgi:hypothetical protein
MLSDNLFISRISLLVSLVLAKQPGTSENKSQNWQKSVEMGRRQGKS